MAGRYNVINEQAAVGNAGASLGMAADRYLAYVKADALKLKANLQKVQNSFIGTVDAKDNPEPAAIPGIMVRRCGRYETQNPDPDRNMQPGKPRVFGAVAYFTNDPKGIAPLLQTGEGMAASLAARYGAEHVGLYGPTGFRYPALMQDPDRGLLCSDDIGGDIKLGSPIVMLGERYIDELIGDTGKSLDVDLTRDVTVPCPPPYTGVVRREQVCKLVTPDLEREPQAKTEQTTVKLGWPGAKVDNAVRRLDKQWRCTPALNGVVPAASPAEIAQFCRDTASTIATPADNAVTLTNLANLKEQLESTGPGYYRFVCRNGGQGSCSAAPYTPPADVTVRCDSNPVNARFVPNPAIPLQLNGAGEVQTDPAKAGSQDCGRGWRGDLIARYLVRRCNLTKDGQPLGTKQTIYHIAYAAAKCQTTISYREQCPAGSPQAGTLPVTRRLEMVDPVAFDWAPVIPGVVNWSSAQIATNETRATRPEIVADAATQGYVIPALNRSDLTGAPDDITWSRRLADGMNTAKPGAVRRTLLACDDSNAPCGSVGTGITIYYDATADFPLRKIGGAPAIYDNLACDGVGSCHAFLGEQQATCSGLCFVDGTKSVDGAATGSGGLSQLRGLEKKIIRYYDEIANQSLPPGITLSLSPVGGSSGMYDSPEFICNIGNLDRSIFIGHATLTFDNGSQSDPSLQYPYFCGTTGVTYNTRADMINDIVEFAKSNGRLIKLYSDVGDPATGYVQDNMLDITGDVTNDIRAWMEQPAPPLSPCAALN